MSVLLERDAAHVMLSDDDHRVRTVLWSPDEPNSVVDALNLASAASRSIVLVVGLSLLEIAEPALPPLNLRERRAVLLRDADRYFPLEEPVAVASEGKFAFAAPSHAVREWLNAFGRVGTVRAVVTAPQVATHAMTTASAALPAPVGEFATIRVIAGHLDAVRRRPAMDEETRSGKSAPLTTIDALWMCKHALPWATATADAQLLDAPMAAAVRQERSRRWIVSGVMTAAALTVLLWSMDRWRERQLVALTAQAHALEVQASPALAAQERAARAQSEIAMLRDADARREAADAPLNVLAHLTRLVPRDVVVQKLEWDGEQWRVDGTADHAPPLVPLIDSDAAFRDVRIAANSQRFLDIGRQRETFSISFRMRVDTAANSAPAAKSGGGSGAI